MTRRIAAILLVTLAVAVLAVPAQAQPLPPSIPQPFNLPDTTIGSSRVFTYAWNFDGDIVGGGPWATLAVTNYQCGATIARGALQGGLLFFLAQLEATPGEAGATVYQGSLGWGGGVGGHARVIVTPDPNPTTHVDVTMWNVGTFYADSVFSVCLSSTPVGTDVGR